MANSSNPALSDKIFERARQNNTDLGNPMTVSGTVNKTFILLLLVLAPAMYTWNMLYSGTTYQNAGAFIIGGAIGGLIAAIVTIVKPNWSAVSAPIYAVFEGLFLGGVSAALNLRFPGIAVQAVALTFGTLGVMLVMYKTGMIKVTEKLRTGIIAATLAVGLFYFVIMIMSLFGGDTSFYMGNSLLSIGISLVIVGIAAFNLLLDFDFIDKGAKMGAPKYMEWFGAFGLMVTLIWLYMEILRLLSKLRD